MSGGHETHGGGGGWEFDQPTGILDAILGILTFAFIVKYATGNPQHGQEGGGGHH